MLEIRKKTPHSISVDRLVNKYQQHPSMRKVELLKAKLKREKLEDKIIFQSLKEKIPTR